MTSIKSLLAADLLAAGDAELRRRDAMQFFAPYLPVNANESWALALSMFVRLRPWRYWDEKTLTTALTVLEQSGERTAEAITYWGRQISAGTDSLLKKSAATDYEESLNLSKPRSCGQVSYVLF
jgi:hypothetical protein